MYSLGAKRRFPCSFWTRRGPRGTTGPRPLAGRWARRTRGRKRCRPSPRVCARSAQPAPVGYSCSTVRPHLPSGIAGARQTNHPGAGSLPHGIGTARRRGTSEIVRTASTQFRGVPAGLGIMDGGPRPHCGDSGIGPLQWYGPSVVFPGEWRNGRRAGFRCQCPSGRGGSSPPSPTLSGSTKGHGLERGRDLRAFRGSAARACARPTVIVGDGCRAGGAGLRVRCAPRPSAATARRSPGSGRRRCGPSPPSSTGPAHCRTAMRRRRVGEPRCRVPARCIRHERRGPRGPSRRSRPHSSAAPRAPARAAPAIRPAGGNRIRAATRHHHVAESERQLCCRTRS